MTAKPEIFFSYAWGDTNEQGESREKIVNELYQSLIEDGFRVVRDKYDLGYKGLISGLASRIGSGKFIVIAISDKYLKSVNCMLEFLEIYRRSSSDIMEMKEKIFPLVLGDAKINDPADRLAYIAFWKARKEALDKKIMEVGLEYAAEVVDDFKIYNEITSNMAVFSGLLKDINTLNPTLLSQDNFSAIKHAIVKRAMELPETELIPPAPWPQLVKKLSYRWLTVLLTSAVLIITLLFTVRVSTTVIKLELSISEVNFRLPKQQVLTFGKTLSSFGASGIQTVQLPAAERREGQLLRDTSGTGLTVHMVIDSGSGRAGTIALDALVLPAGEQLGIRFSDVPGQHRLSVEGKAFTLPVYTNGLVQIGLQSRPPEKFTFPSPATILLQSGTENVDMDLAFSSGGQRLFSSSLPAESLSLLRVNEYSDENLSTVRTVSTILSGTLYFESLSGQERRLLPYEQIQFKWSQGEVRTLELQGDHIAFIFYGSVQGMTTGDNNRRTSLMPTYMEWLRARLGLFGAGAILLIIFALIFSALRWRRT